MPPLSLCMIVRDEAEVLGRCLDSVAGVADELIVVDTGSADATPEIARHYGARVERFAWCDDFAAARNRSFELATKKYILWLDADDVLLPEARRRLIELKARLRSDVYYLRYDYAQDADGFSRYLLYRERIVRNRPEIRWNGAVHETLDVSGLCSETVDIVVSHRRTARSVRSDRGRNLRILQRLIETPEHRGNYGMQFYLAREHYEAGHPAEALLWYRRSLARDPSKHHRALTHYRIALCHAALASEDGLHLEHARTAARKALRLDPRRSEPAFLLGILALAAGNVEEAIPALERAAGPEPAILGPIDPVAYGIGPTSLLCICYDRLGDFRRAHHYNELSLLERPGDPTLLGNRRLLRAKLEGTQPRSAQAPRLMPRMLQEVPSWISVAVACCVPA